MGKNNVYFEVSIENKKIGKIEFELYDEICPKTCDNFRTLCNGKSGKSKRFNLPLWYGNTFIHRIIKGFVIQGGDIEYRDNPEKMGFGGESIFGRTFDDENFEIKHLVSGTLSMANSGVNTNGSQFFITLSPRIQHLDGKHVVFGRVVKGMEVVRKMEEIDTGENDFPVKSIEITQSGECNPRTSKRKRKKRTTLSDSESSSDSSSSSSSEEEVEDKKVEKVEKKERKERKKSPERKKKRRRDERKEEIDDDLDERDRFRKKRRVDTEDFEIYDRIRKMNEEKVVLKKGKSEEQNQKITTSLKREYKGRGSMRYNSSEEEDSDDEKNRYKKRGGREYGSRDYSSNRYVRNDRDYYDRGDDRRKKYYSGKRD